MDWTAIVPTIISAAAVSIAIGWLKAKAFEYNPKGNFETQGLIQPRKSIIMFIFSIGFIFFLLGLLATLNWEEMIVYGPFVAIMGAFFMVGVLPSFTNFHDIRWNENNLSGPSSLRFQTLWFKRTSLDWSEILSISYDKSQHYFIENRMGDKIYWSKYFKGYEDFETSLKTFRPDLKWPQITQ